MRCYLLISFFVFLAMLAEGKVKPGIDCVVKGELVGLEVEEVKIVKMTDDYRFHGTDIPVKNNKFEYRLALPFTEAYQVIFVDRRRQWHKRTFFPENGVIRLVCQPDGIFEVEGGELNERYNRLLKERTAFFTQGENKGKDPFTLKYEYLERNPDEMSYFLLIKDLEEYQGGRYDADPRMIRMYECFAQKMPEHPYTRLGQIYVMGLNQIRIGGQFVDFEAPDLEGKLVKVSEQIQGKIAVIDLWASWCMPCRAKAKALIPVYEQYKDKGFTVVAVAREFKNTDKMKKAIAADGYPWLQLVELDDARQIWKKYMINNWGGAVFLVDRQGKIRAINPNLEEIRELIND